MLMYSHTLIFSGPSWDHTSGTGKYLNIDSSAPRVQNDSATIQYEFSEPVVGGCFSLYYTMYGSTIGSLTVTASDGSRSTDLWSLKGPHGAKWHLLSTVVPQQTTMVCDSIVK